MIELEFTVEEVTSALYDFCGGKPHGLDGMTISSRIPLKVDVLRLLCDFFHLGKFVASLNATFIRLILKKANSKNISLGIH